MLTISGTIKVDAVDDIFISKATVVDGTAKVNAYNMTTLSSSVTLETAKSTATISVTVTNNSPHDKVFNRVKYLDEAYSNPNVGYVLEGIAMGTLVPHNPTDGKNTLTFSITFLYTGSNTSNPTLDSVIMFEFADAADWEEGGDDNPDDDSSDSGNDDSSSGTGSGQIAVGEDFHALIEAAKSNVRGSYGLNDPQKGSVLVNAVKKQEIVYSSDNLQGGNIKHFASETRNTHNLDYLFEFISETEYVMYIWRLADVEKAETLIGQTAITVYKQVYHKENNVWKSSTTMAGYAVIKNIRNNSGSMIVAMVPSEWAVGHVIAE